MAFGAFFDRVQVQGATCNGDAVGERYENGMMFRSLLCPDFIYFTLSVKIRTQRRTLRFSTFIPLSPLFKR
jgi:hypothetical protein